MRLLSGWSNCQGFEITSNQAMSNLNRQPRDNREVRTNLFANLAVNACALLFFCSQTIFCDGADETVKRNILLISGEEKINPNSVRQQAAYLSLNDVYIDQGGHARFSWLGWAMRLLEQQKSL